MHKYTICRTGPPRRTNCVSYTNTHRVETLHDVKVPEILYTQIHIRIQPPPGFFYKKHLQVQEQEKKSSSTTTTVHDAKG